MLDAEDYFVAAQAERKERELRAKYQGRFVTLTRGKYAGRRGFINGVHLDAYKGRWLFLVMVLRKDGTDTLNSEPETRMYHPTWDFTLEEGRWSPTSREAKNVKPDDVWFGSGRG